MLHFFLLLKLHFPVNQWTCKLFSCTRYAHIFDMLDSTVLYKSRKRSIIFSIILYSTAYKISPWFTRKFPFSSILNWCLFCPVGRWMKRYHRIGKLFLFRLIYLIKLCLDLISLYIVLYAVISNECRNPFLELSTEEDVHANIRQSYIWKFNLFYLFNSSYLSNHFFNLVSNAKQAVSINVVTQLVILLVRIYKKFWEKHLLDIVQLLHLHT